MKFVRTVFILSVGAFLAGWTLPTRLDPKVEEGNRMYQQKKYAAALRHYDEAELANKTQGEMSFNRGTALARLAMAEPDEKLRTLQQQRARALLTEATATPKVSLRAAAFYNLGTMFLVEDSFPEAIAALRQTLRLDPGQMDARYNLHLAIRRAAERQKNRKGAEGLQPPSGREHGATPATAPPRPRRGSHPRDFGANGNKPVAEIDKKLDALERRSNQLRGTRINANSAGNSRTTDRPW